MIIYGRPVLLDFVRKHADSLNAIDKWVCKVENSEWSNFNELKQDFPNASLIGNDHVVFDIRGNNYRLVTIVIFTEEVLSIRWVGTHAAYDKIKDCSVL